MSAATVTRSHLYCGAYYKEPVKLTKRVKIAHSFLQFVSDQFHVMLAYVILQMAVKEFFETDF